MIVMICRNCGAVGEILHDSHPTEYKELLTPIDSKCLDCPPLYSVEERLLSPRLGV